MSVVPKKKTGASFKTCMLHFWSYFHKYLNTSLFCDTQKIKCCDNVELFSVFFTSQNLRQTFPWQFFYALDSLMIQFHTHLAVDVYESV